jgi:hypothetical protein
MKLKLSVSHSFALVAATDVRLSHSSVGSEFES